MSIPGAEFIVEKAITTFEVVPRLLLTGECRTRPAPKNVLVGRFLPENAGHGWPLIMSLWAVSYQRMPDAGGP